MPKTAEIIIIRSKMFLLAENNFFPRSRYANATIYMMFYFRSFVHAWKRTFGRLVLSKKYYYPVCIIRGYLGPRSKQKDRATMIIKYKYKCCNKLRSRCRQRLAEGPTPLSPYSPPPRPPLRTAENSGYYSKKIHSRPNL